jgi:CelD/BcsL family acetyltransferase involved in cellulose biosynthesis
MYKYKIFDSINEELKDIWKKNEKNLSYTFFQNIDYLQEISKINNTKFKIIVIFDEDNILAILPLEIKKYFFLNILQWIGTGYADYCNPVIKNNNVNFNKKYFLDMWSKALKDVGKIDLIFFNNQLSRIDKIMNPFVDYFKTSLFSKVYQIQLQNSFDDYKDQIKKKDKKHFYEVHRTLIKFDKLKKIAKINFFVEDSYKNEIEVKKLINEKRALLGNKNIKNNLNSKFIKILENLILLKKIKFFSMKLKIDNEIISTCFGFIFKESFYYYIPSTFPKKFDNFKPGKILITEIIKWCILNNVKLFDFGLGAEKYKKYFSNKEILLHRYFSYFTFKGFIAYYLLAALFKIKSL